MTRAPRGRTGGPGAGTLRGSGKVRRERHAPAARRRGPFGAQHRVERAESAGAHRHARGDERRDGVERRLEALPLPVEADDERLALAEDRADPAAAGRLRPVLDEDADAVLPGREDGRAQVERPVRLAEDRLRAALGRRHVADAGGVHVEAGGRIEPRPEEAASSAGGAGKATPRGPRRARERGRRAGSRGARPGSAPAPRRRGRRPPRRRRRRIRRRRGRSRGGPSPRPRARLSRRRRARGRSTTPSERERPMRVRPPRSSRRAPG